VRPRHQQQVACSVQVPQVVLVQLQQLVACSVQLLQLQPQQVGLVQLLLRVAACLVQVPQVVLVQLQQRAACSVQLLQLQLQAACSGQEQLFLLLAACSVQVLQLVLVLQQAVACSAGHQLQRNNWLFQHRAACSVQLKQPRLSSLLQLHAIMTTTL